MRVAALLLALVSGCATVEVYRWQPRPLPAGSPPLAAIVTALHGLRNVSWSYGEPDPDPGRHARVDATGRGLTGLAYAPAVAGSPLDLSYGEIAEGARMVTALDGAWTVFIYDRHGRLVRLEFDSHEAVRLFLDGAHALAADRS